MRTFTYCHVEGQMFVLDFLVELAPLYRLGDDWTIRYRVDASNDD